MKNFIQLIDEKLMPVANKIASNDVLNALRHSMMGMVPFFMIGSFFLVAAYLPIEGYTKFLNSTFGEGVFQGVVTSVSGATINMMGLIVLIAVAYNYAKIKNTDTIYAIVASLMAFLIITPIEDGIFPLEWLGAKGMFISIILAIVVTNIYIKVEKKGIAPKMPDSVPPAVMKAFAALVPILAVSFFAITIRVVFMLTQYEHVHNFIFEIVQTPLLNLGNNLFSLIVAEMVGQLLWFFGLHGNDIVGSVMRPIWLTQSTQNLEAFTAGLPLPNIITEQMRNTFMLIGGSGSTLSLVLLLLILTKSKQLKSLGYLALPAAIFNINEPIIFGLPIVLNPIMLIPWLINTPIAGIITYLSMDLGLVNLTNGIIIPWTTPVFASGYLVSGVSGLILQGVLLGVGFLIYYPFIKALDKKLYKEEHKKDKDDDLDLSSFEF